LCIVTHVTQAFARDRLTWLAYLMLGWFAYLQAAPGLIIVHLRDELDIGYATGGLHVAAFAAGSVVAGTTSARLERALGRRTLFWSAAVLMYAGTIGLTAGRVAGVTVGSVLVMGLGGGALLVTIQAALADHHGQRRTVALTEANVAASVAYLVLIGVLSLTAVLHAGWRVALLASLPVPALAWWANRRLAIDAPPPSPTAHGRLPRAFWIAAATLFCATAVEWCITAWGATFVEDAAGVSTDTAVALMAGYFGGVVVGRAVGSRLAVRHDPERLLALARSPCPPSASRFCGRRRGPRRRWSASRCSGSVSATCSRWGCPWPSRSRRDRRHWPADGPWWRHRSRCCSRPSRSGHSRMRRR
jgi:predicted MFS family arabinose efflux permease